MARMMQNNPINFSRRERTILQDAFGKYVQFLTREAVLKSNEISYLFSRILEEVEDLCSKLIEGDQRSEITKIIDHLSYEEVPSEVFENPLISCLVPLINSRNYSQEDILRELMSRPSSHQSRMEEIFNKTQEIYQPIRTPAPVIPTQPSYELSTEIHAHKDGILSLAISEDQTTFATGSRDRTVKVWDAESLALMYNLEGHNDFVKSVAFLGKKIVTGSYDETVKIWNESRCENTMRFHNSGVNSVSVSPSKKLIASASIDTTIVVYNLHTNSLHYPPLHGHQNIVTSVDFSPNEMEIVSGSWDKTIKVWKTENGDLLFTLQGHTDVVLCINFSRRFLLTSSLDRSIILWERRNERHVSYREITHFVGHNRRVESVDSNDFILFSLGNDDTIKVWEIGSSQEIQSLQGHGKGYKFIDPTNHRGGVKLLQEGSRAISGGYDGKIKVWRRIIN